MKYLVRIGDVEHQVDIDGDRVTVNGREVRAHVAEVEGTPVRLLSMNDAVHRVIVRRGATRGAYRLSLGGWQFDAEALDERTRAIRELAGPTRKAGSGTLVAPMPGLIVRVNVQEGEAVQAGQGLVVMEAMKMENELRAPAAGTVKRVVVTAGTAVEKGALLLEMA